MDLPHQDRDFDFERNTPFDWWSLIDDDNDDDDDDNNDFCQNGL